MVTLLVVETPSRRTSLTCTDALWLGAVASHVIPWAVSFNAIDFVAPFASENLPLASTTSVGVLAALRAIRVPRETALALADVFAADATSWPRSSAVPAHGARWQEISVVT